MSRRTTDEQAARRGPERRTRSAEPAVEAPRTGPADGWPTASAAADRAHEPDRPASTRVRKKRRVPRRTRLAKASKRIGYGALVVALLAGLAVVVALIVAPHHLF
ncbi:hypothetical protein NB037_09240 [Rathayibacter sp. ZW T2_19]|uniref:Uncharacterized protein n=1 Tax=Rathayibacter rubneri TaxID=2950106 RepID=A0A9X2ISE1_9MICO|nr:hypothetical protein [Rathayibacter rubneri]MCM6762596.1 hypothetical protein [Rathayibacter rubneri]